MIQQVKDEIIAAFADVPRPVTLAIEFGDEHKESIEPLQNLSGKDWKELDEQFLNENWSALYLLTAEAYQYYLPALLICSLESSPQSDIFFHTFNRLSPNSWYVLYEGRDERFDYQTSLLTSEQRQAICSFLGAIFDEPYGYRMGRIKYQVWVKDFPDHPASIKIRDYYDHLHNFHYPPAIKPKNRRLIELIRNAFNDTPAPSNILNRPMIRKGDDEGPDFALAFHGLNWRTVHPSLLGEAGLTICFLSDEEFRYFLPAFMIADIWQQDKFYYDRPNYSYFGSHDVDSNLTISLTKFEFQETIETDKQYIDSKPSFQVAVESEKTPDQADYSRNSRWANFTSPERKAIIAYLQFKIRQNISHRRKQLQIKRSLRNYWSKTV